MLHLSTICYKSPLLWCMMGQNSVKYRLLVPFNLCVNIIHRLWFFFILLFYISQCEQSSATNNA